MIPLHRDRHFASRFGHDRISPRSTMEGVSVGVRVGVFRIDPVSGERFGRLTTGTAGDGGWWT